MNHLADQTSPYLRQHADNPVEWYPWGEDAFARARAEDRPILLSVGYSACHWCHVMAHESFEDPDVAAVMNRLFVNIKVDREERPDVDSIYMHAVQAMTGQGGWPMTVFLMPDGQPFYGGTYYPKNDRGGMPGFVRVMEAIDDAWRTRRDALAASAAQLRQAIEHTTQISNAGGNLTANLLKQAEAAAAGQFDAQYGGFGGPPKFPQAMTLDFLLSAAVRDPSPETLEMVTVSLDAMAAGGMYDQVGGGFHRYSVDAFWLVPHFEKMLYDQALLLRTYLHGFLVTGEARYRRVVEETIGYVLRDLRHADGGFFSAEDADSEGVEGKFYVWSVDEVEAICGDDAPEVMRYFGVTSGGNFYDPHTSFRGSILHLVDRTAARSDAVERALPKLFAAREHRVRPGLDDKVLLAWNSLFLRGLSEAASALDRDDWMEAARTNARFLLTSMRRDDGRLLRSWQDGRAGILAYAEDYAALLEALITLAEVDDVSWLGEARTVADGLLTLFADAERGGVYTTGIDAEPLIVRPKDIQDNATPCENSLAANGLLRLAALTGEVRYEDAALSWVRPTAGIAAQHPTAFAYLLGAVERAVHAPIEIAVIGPADDPDTDALWNVITQRLLPAAVALRSTPGDHEDVSPLLAGRSLVDGRATAYVCERYACRQPITTVEELHTQLDDALTARS